MSWRLPNTTESDRTTDDLLKRISLKYSEIGNLNYVTELTIKDIGELKVFENLNLVTIKDVGLSIKPQLCKYGLV